jgi:hypothetical protein
MTLSAPLAPGGVLFWDDQGIRTTKLKVDLPTNTFVNIRLFTVPVEAGDTLLITGEVNLTTAVGRDATGKIVGKEYAVGVATSVWIYNASGPPELRPATYQRLGTNGENVTPQGHHIQQGLTRPYVVPATWDPTHQIAVLLRVDVHSTGWDDNSPAGSDYVIVEQHGTLQCQRWRQPEPPVDDPRWVDLEARLVALEQPTEPEVPTCP